MPLKYLSLFSGIGGFEIAIHNVFPDAICIGYSEVDKFAIKVYEQHFPTHKNLGDITKITKEDIERVVAEHGGCDLVVGGFPCQNLSSLARLNGDEGLKGSKSKLFFNVVKILRWLKSAETNINIILENNASMRKEYSTEITRILSSIFPFVEINSLDNNQFGIQKRNRFYWTTFKCITQIPKITQTWSDILCDISAELYYLTEQRILRNNKPVSDKVCKNVFCIDTENYPICTSYNTTNGFRNAWSYKRHSKTFEWCVPIIRSHNIVIDTRFGNKNEFVVRNFNSLELERLFFIPNGWVSSHCSRTRSRLLLGNTVSVKVIEYLLTNLKVLLTKLR